MNKLIMRTQTADVFDIQAVLQLGLSAKADGAIGRFGSGLKYAIAQVLARDGKLRITTAPEGREPQSYIFHTEARSFRDKNYEQVLYTDNTGVGHPTGFTTHLGFEWKPWQLARELICNTLDEGGTWEIVPTTLHTSAAPGEVLFEVECPSLIQAVEEEHIFLDTTITTHWQVLDLQILSAPSNYIYAKGVRVGETPLKLPFTLNWLGEMSEIGLTEDRSSSFYTFEGKLSDCFETFAVEDPSEMPRELLETVFRPIFKSRETCELSANLGFVRRIASPHPFVMAYLTEHSRLIENEDLEMTIVRAKRRANGTSFLGRSVTDTEWTRIQEAFPFLELLNLKPLGRDRFQVANDMAYSTVACYVPREGVIYIAPKAFELSKAAFHMMMFEEHLHATEGVSDFTRGFQNACLVRLYAAVMGAGPSRLEFEREIGTITTPPESGAASRVRAVVNTPF